MIEDRITIGDEVGLHARPAALFVRTADRYDVQVTVTREGVTVNGRSILALLTLAAEKGSVVTLRVTGKGEAAAFKTLAAILRGEIAHE